MPYIKRAMSDRETLLAFARPHWIYLIKALFWGALCIVGMHWIDNMLYSYLTHNAINFTVDLYFVQFSEQFTPLPWMGWGLGLMLFWTYFSIYISHEVGLTDQRFIHKKGVFFVTLEEADLEDIRAEYIEHGLLGWLFRYGYIELDSRFTGNMNLPAMSKPHVLVRESHKARMKHPKIVYDKKALDENLARLEEQEQAALTEIRLGKLHDHILKIFKKAS